jgi:hypothetical protein
MLSSAIDDSDPDADSVVAVLEGIDGAWERAGLARQQVVAGETVELGDL